MASAIIHICVAKKISERLQRNSKDYYLGSIAPDLSKQIGEPKLYSHFQVNAKKESVPVIEDFIKKYQNEIQKDFELGYFIHLYTDKLWFDGFIDKLVCNNSIKLIDGTIISAKPEEITNLIYNDYTSLNIDLIDYYDLDLSLFYEEFIYPKSNITEIPIDKLNLVVEQMGIIIENSKKEKNYIFDISLVTNFIDNAADEIYDYLIKNLIIEQDNYFKKPIIGITSRFDLDKKLMNYSKNAEIGEYYIKAVNKYGGIPIGILPVQEVLFTDLGYDDVPKLTTEDKAKIMQVLDMCDGIIMTGGGRWYEYDEFICQCAKEKDIPTLGICLGMQLMGYVSRINNKDITAYINSSSINHKDLGNRYVHGVTFDKNSNLYRIFNKDITLVNSRHDFNIGPEEDINMDIVAKSEDGIVEAIEDKNKEFFVGVQWHPELMDEYDKTQGKLLKNFINTCEHRNV